MRGVPGRGALIGLWALAAAILVAAMVISWHIGSMHYELYNPAVSTTDPSDEQQRWQILQVLQSLVAGLALIGAVVPMIAVASHAIRWERMHRVAADPEGISPGSRP